MDEQLFWETLKKVKIPVLVLDQKWHRLFALGGKPEEIVEVETNINELLRRQGKLNQEIKEYKKVKNTLMQSVVANMEGIDEEKASGSMSRKLEEDRRLLEEVKERIAANEDELLELPKEIHKMNEQLMMLTMSFCYERLRTNSTEAGDIAAWIKNVRVELKKNIIRKQNREINNKEIYSYMHDIFGKDVINLFDVRYDDFELGTKDDKAEPPDQEKKQSQ